MRNPKLQFAAKLQPRVKYHTMKIILNVFFYIKEVKRTCASISYECSLYLFIFLYKNVFATGQKLVYFEYFVVHHCFSINIKSIWSPTWTANKRKNGQVCMDDVLKTIYTENRWCTINLEFKAPAITDRANSSHNDSGA